MYLTQAYNVLLVLSINDTYVGLNHGTFEGAVNNLLGTTLEGHR